MKEISEKIKKCSEWLHKQNNSVKVGLAGLVSAIIFVFTYFVAIKDSNENSVGYWNFIILIVSSPVAFVIWHFRDENSRQQIENQRKDINLKEFQKLSEWVSGAHLPEIKVIDENIEKSFKANDEFAVSPERKTIEEKEEHSKEYGQNPDIDHFDTFGKRDGAVALQISAIYNLLPFFRGDYGESFRLPTFNLLKSAWQAMQKDELNELNELDELNKLKELYKLYLERANEYEKTTNIKYIGKILKSFIKGFIEQLNKTNKLKSYSYNLYKYCEELEKLNKESQQKIELYPNNRKGIYNSLINKLNKELEDIMYYTNQKIRENSKKLQYKGSSPIGVALTHVLLSLNQKGTHLNLQDFSEILKNICLAGMDFNLLEIEKEEYALNNLDFSMANFQGASLRKINFQESNLSHANFQYASLQEAKLKEAEISFIKSENADLSHSDLRKAKGLSYLEHVKSLDLAKINITDFSDNFYYFEEKNSKWENLTEPERKEAMQTFCNETGMIIFDDDDKENIVAEPKS